MEEMEEIVAQIIDLTLESQQWSIKLFRLNQSETKIETYHMKQLHNLKKGDYVRAVIQNGQLGLINKIKNPQDQSLQVPSGNPIQNFTKVLDTIEKPVIGEYEVSEKVATVADRITPRHHYPSYNDFDGTSNHEENTNTATTPDLNTDPEVGSASDDQSESFTEDDLNDGDDLQGKMLGTGV